MTNLSRLSPYNITDDLYRVELYRDIRSGGDDFQEYEIMLDEVHYPELISYRYYGTKSLKWVIAVTAKLDDWREPLIAGEILMLPTKKWIRQRIRHYQALYG